MVTNICVSLVHIVSLSEQPSCFVPVTARSSLMNNILPVTLMNINLRNYSSLTLILKVSVAHVFLWLCTVNKFWELLKDCYMYCEKEKKKYNKHLDLLFIGISELMYVYARNLYPEFAACFVFWRSECFNSFYCFSLADWPGIVIVCISDTLCSVTVLSLVFILTHVYPELT